jgi:hypothetical protein
MNLARLNRTETFTTKDTKFTKFKSINVRTLRDYRATIVENFPGLRKFLTRAPSLLSPATGEM